MRDTIRSEPLTLLRWTATLLLGLLVAVNACLAGNATTHLVMGFAVKSFPDVDVKDAHAAMEIWAKELASGAGIEAESRVYNDFEQLLADLRGGKISMAIFPAVDFLRVEHSLNAPLAFAGVVDGKVTQRYVVLTSTGTAHHEIASLKGARLAHVSNDEMGLLYLNTLLLKNRQSEMDRFFASIQTKSKSSQAIHAVYFGTADVCIVTERSFHRMTELNPQVGRKLKAIAVSPELLRDVSLYSPNTSIGFRDRLELQTHIVKETPRGKQVLTLFQVDDFTKMLETSLVQARQMYREYMQLKEKRIKGKPQ